jgi:flagellar L-ring protein precursor FlgH
MNRLILLIPTVIMSLLVGGCVSHIQPYKPKRRAYNLPVPHAAYDGAKATGSLFDPTGPGIRLTTDARAQAVNDLVVIIIDENATAQRDMNSESSKQSQANANLERFLGLISKLQKEYKDFEGINALNLTHGSSFKGQGKTSRSDRLQATVPAMVRQVLPNGNLFVEGDRVVLVNREEHHFYISGVIRPEDIDGSGQVRSSRMADAQIEFTGRGDMTAGATKGWFTRMLDYVWPF